MRVRGKGGKGTDYNLQGKWSTPTSFLIHVYGKEKGECPSSRCDRIIDIVMSGASSYSLYMNSFAGDTYYRILLISEILNLC